MILSRARLGLFCFMTALIFLPHSAWTAAIAPGEALTLSRAVELAVTKHPVIIAGINTVKVNEARIGEARANYYPQLSITENYLRSLPASRGTTSVTSTPGLPSGTTYSTTSTGVFDQYTTSANLTQTILDFGKTASQVRIQTLTTDSTRADLENARNLVAFNVKQAYFNLLQAQRNREAILETVRQFESHLRQAQGFYKAGTQPRFAITKAEVDLSNARVNLIKAENQVRLAKVTLNNAMGVPDAPEDYRLADSLAFESYPMSFEEALHRAYGGRSDLRSIVRKKDAAKESINLSHKGFLPVVTGNATYYYTGSSFPLNEGWSVGAILSLPIFSGFLTKYQVLEAVSARDVISANEQALKQDILLQVQQAYSNLRDASERITATRIGVRQARENMDLAQGRYKAGVGNPIEITDSVAAFGTAEISYTQALYDYRVAVAAIENAIGGR
ncbi:MAG TPA: TolC family protein [Syntrophorhabdaceae bacterium]